MLVCRGPRTVPWGTPVVTEEGWEVKDFSLMNNKLQNRDSGGVEFTLLSIIENLVVEETLKNLVRRSEKKSFTRP